MSVKVKADAADAFKNERRLSVAVVDGCVIAVSFEFY